MECVSRLLIDNNKFAVRLNCCEISKRFMFFESACWVYRRCFTNRRLVRCDSNNLREFQGEVDMMVEFGSCPP